MEIAKRSTMLGVNLFGSKKAKKMEPAEKKVNFESGSDDEKLSKRERKNHYKGNFQSQYRKKQFIENPGSDDEQQAEDDEFFDYNTNSERPSEDASN